MTELEINNLYNKYIKVNHTIEYNNRYSKLPIEFNNKNWKWEGKDFPRIISLLEFRNYMVKYNFNFDHVLTFNGHTDPEMEYIKHKESTHINYTDDIINNDLHTLMLPKRDFDFVMLNQTIEHLYDPITCIKNIYNHLKKGAIFYANVPVNNIPHSTPYHYYTGVTPTGLGIMIKKSGFEILEIGQWGNLEYLQKLFTEGWIDYRRMTNYTNDMNIPIITWILAKKI